MTKRPATKAKSPATAPNATDDLVTEVATSESTAGVPAPKTPRPNTKLAGIIERLRTPDGATIADLQVLTGWQEHSIRGVLAGSFKRKFGLTIISEKDERGRVYRIGEPMVVAQAEPQA